MPLEELRISNITTDSASDGIDEGIGDNIYKPLAGLRCAAYERYAFA